MTAAATCSLDLTREKSRISGAVPDGYSQGQIVFENHRTLVLRAVHDADGQPVIIKTFSQAQPEEDQAARLRYEYELLQANGGGDVIRAVELVTTGRQHFLVLEDIGGSALSVLLADVGPLAVEEILPIAIRLVSALAKLHSNNVIHKDLNPSNIVYNADTDQLRIIDFGTSVKLSSERPELSVIGSLEGTLAYLAPEQSGRMNRTLDYRSDYYSLGVTLFQLCTGQLPFQADDLIGWIHCHIAKAPPLASAVNRVVPPMLAGIIHVLLAKDANDRYQSATALCRDLEECSRRLDEGETSQPFALSNRVLGPGFRVPNQLLGRDSQMSELMSAFERSASGEFELFFVAGFSGVGKSALVREVQKSIVESHGVFCEGKFDQYNRNVPYSAFAGAIAALARALLGEPEEKLAAWRSRITDAVGIGGRVVTRLFPDIEKIIGEQPALVELSPSDSSNRLLAVLASFMQVFCRAESPLVMFLDDMQWCDHATLKLLDHLQSQPALGHLLVIAAYRDNEVDESHILQPFLERAIASGRGHLVSVPVLGADSVAEITANTLACDIESATDVADLVYRKTGGNPFFVNELLRSLYRGGLFVFDHVNGRWSWDVGELNKANVSNDVVELMLSRLQAVDQSTRDVLRLAGCVGSEFKLREVAFLAGKDQAETSLLLRSAAQTGILIPLDDSYKMAHLRNGDSCPGPDVSYKFQHDRLQQACYSLIDDASAVHFDIATMLAADKPPRLIGNEVIRIAHHYLEGTSAEAARGSEERMAEYLLCAGLQTKASGAYESSVLYLRAAQALLPDDRWASHYAITQEVYRELLEALYLSGVREEALAIGETALQHTRDDFDKAELHRRLSMRASLAGEHDLCVREAIVGMGLLGHKFPYKPIPPLVLRELGLARFKMRGRTVEELLHAPELSDKRVVMTLDLLAMMAPSAFVLGYMPRFALTVLRTVTLSLEYGSGPAAAASYTFFATLLTVMGQHALAKRFADLGKAMERKHHPTQQESVISVCYGMFVSPRSDTLAASVRAYENGIESGQRMGDLVNASFCAAKLLGLDSRETLPHQQAQGEPLIRITSASGAKEPELMAKCAMAFIQAMQREDGPASLESTEFSPQEAARQFQKMKFHEGEAFITSAQIRLAFFIGDAAEGLKQALLLDKNANSLLVDGAQWLYYTYYGFLCAAATYHSGTPRLRRKALSFMKKKAKAMQKWSDHFSGNHAGHMLPLMRAELARAKGKFESAVGFYEYALSVATERGFAEYEAVIHERLALFHLGCGGSHLGELCMRHAVRAYEKWGAIAKVRRLEQDYPALARGPASGAAAKLGAGIESSTTHSDRQPTIPKPRDLVTTVHARPGRASNDNGSSDRRIDATTISKATQVLSSEVVMSRLVRRLMDILAENAGAQRISLLLKNDAGALRIQGERDAAGELAVLQDAPLSQESDLCAQIVFWVSRNKKSLILDNAASQGDYTEDPYIKKSQCRSLLCLPILTQGELLGILYLENESVAGTFTSERAELLEVLATQAGISLRNALLYQSLEAKVAARTAQLVVRNRDMRTVLDNVRQGFVTVDLEGVLGPERSAILERWFFTPHEGATLWELLAEASPSRAEALEAMWSQISMGLLPLEVSLGQLPTRFTGESSTWEVEFHPIGEPNNAERVLVVLTDITATLEKQRAEADIKEMIELLRRANQGRMAFIFSVDNLEEMVDGLSGTTHDDDVVYRRVLHTLKGDSGLLGMQSVSTVCHELEVQIDEAGGALPDAEARQMLRDTWSKLRAKCDVVLGSDGGKNLEISTSEHEWLLSVLGTQDGEVRGRVEGWSLEPVSSTFARLGEWAAELGRRLNKPRLRIEIIDPDGLRLEPKVWAPFWADFVHLLRNAVDHGFDSESKPGASGCLTFAAKAANGQLEISLSDDGNGLAWDKIKEKGATLDIPCESKEQMVEAVFHDGFTTRQQASQTSGRGVGLSAVRARAEEMGGTVGVDLQHNPGTRWLFRFPTNSLVIRKSVFG